MKIYFAHSTAFDYQNEYYHPIEASPLSQTHKLIFPHKDDNFINTKDIINSCDLVVAEVSYPSTGMGIELGWASAANKPITALFKSGTKPSQSLSAVTSNIIEYSPGKLVDALNESMATL